MRLLTSSPINLWTKLLTEANYGTTGTLQTEKNSIMKALITAVLILTTTLCYAQNEQRLSNCNDTIRICGYYIIVQRENDLRLSKTITKLNARKHTNKYVINDLFINYLFIPLDSVSNKYNLASRVDNFCNDSKTTIFKVCNDPILLKNYCDRPTKTGSNLCKLTKTLPCELVKTTNNTGEVYKVFYIEGYWKKVKVKNSPFERGQVGGLTATRCIKSGPRFFDLYFCTSIQNIKPATNLSEKGMIRMD